MAAQPSPLMASVMADSGRILDSLSTSVLIVDRNRSLLYLNGAAETLFGVSRNQVRGRPLAELVERLRGPRCSDRSRGNHIATFLTTRAGCCVRSMAKAS